MSNPSNLYAEKIFAEHPIGLWALDEDLDYISLISEEQRDILSEWSVSGGTAFSGSSITEEPFTDSFSTIIKGDLPVGDTSDIILISPDLANLSSLDEEKASFSVGSFVFCDSAYLNNISFGYEYTDPDTLEIIQNLKIFNSIPTQSWLFLSETFDLQNIDANFRIVIKMNVSAGGTTTDAYSFVFNGITSGQWAEEFQVTSLGLTTTTVPSNISTYGGKSCIETTQYGLAEDPGYYIASPKLLAKNTSIPLVYGASNVTKLFADSDASIIFPGKGFLNNKGRFLDYTVEFWTRIDSGTTSDKRIFGPIGSSDGLYVNGGVLSFVIGENFGSYAVGEWFRPMLIDLRVIKDNASVLINGEQVISFSFDSSSVNFPNELDELGKNQDWLGFYSYDEIISFEIDCFAIYPYQVPVNVAKRRWVYGQAVTSAQAINSAYNGTSAFIDYTYADYTANYSYPAFAKWSQGTFDNLSTNATSLTTPNYSLPEIFNSTKTIAEFYADNKLVQSGQHKFITFKPNETWNDNQGYINFPSLNVLNDEVHSIYAVFNSDRLDNEENIFTIYNTVTGNFFTARRDMDEIHYYLSFNGIEKEIYTTSAILEDEIYSAGINLDQLVSYFGGDVATFFGNRSGLQIYVAGDASNQYSFSGKLYAFGICTKFNSSLISSMFRPNGTIDESNGELLLNNKASYTLVPSDEYGSFFLDISSYGYWEDYLPLSYFAQYVKDSSGNNYYDLDFLQFNVDYPAPIFLHDVDGNSVFNTDNASVKTYITFQYITDGANTPFSNFVLTEPLNNKGVISLDDYENWTTTKFEVANNTIIYPSKLIDFNDLAIVCHIEFYANAILSDPVQVKNLSIGSQVLNSNSFNPIGTRFGIDLFPYKKVGFYYDNKGKNPYSIYKGSTPYLYLTKYSGIKIRGDFDSSTSRGVAISINPSKSQNYQINALQIWMKYDDILFPEQTLELFDIKYKADTIKFYFVADTTQRNRGKIFATSLNTSEIFDGLAYYINGKLVKDPRISLNEWVSFGISFSTSLNFDSYAGLLSLNGPMTFNNISYYQANSVQQLQKYITRPWISVKNDGMVDLDWQYWFNDYIWQDVLVISSSNLYTTNPDDIYKAYIGTNKIIVDDSEGMLFSDDKIKIYTEASWQSIVKTPV